MLTGLFFGNLLPMNGKGIGPGGIDLQTLRSCRRTRIGKAMRPTHVYHESNIDTKDIVIDLWILSETIDTKEKSLRISRRFSIIVEAFKVSSPQAQVGTTGFRAAGSHESGPFHREEPKNGRCSSNHQNLSSPKHFPSVPRILWLHLATTLFMDNGK